MSAISPFDCSLFLISLSDSGCGEERGWSPAGSRQPNPRKPSAWLAVSADGPISDLMVVIVLV